MMQQPSPFESLCDACGIVDAYDDIWGERHPVPKKVRRALLQAMGVDVRDGPAIEAALRARECRHWESVLPPVQVVTPSGEAVRVALNLPMEGSGGGKELTWVLEREDGQQHRGRFAPAELPLLERHHIGRRTWLRYSLELTAELPLGYHQLVLNGDAGELARMSLIVAPARCYQPAILADGGRLWGPAVQLYALRSERNWGVGDFTDLGHLLDFAAENGAGIVGVSPLHALFPHAPEHASPYSPSSRQFFNILFIDVESIADYGECAKAQYLVQSEPFQTRLRALRTAERVDYTGVAEAKGEVFELLFRHFSEHHLRPGPGGRTEGGTERGEAFRRFQAESGEALFRHALFEALQEHFHNRDGSTWGWPAWPEAFRDPGSREVAEFAAGSMQRVEFYQYLQWQARLQLQAVGQHSYDLGLGTGLYQDLAVSIDRGGAEAWGNQGLYALDARIGSPPDDYNLTGQDWGLPPQIPAQLQAMAYAPFIATLRSNMRATGALRIDHVMALMRLYWIPAGGSAVNGGYVHYPLHDLLGILALESQRNRCLVIGEDLGTVPAEIRQALKPLGVLSCSLFFFEKDARGEFSPPEAFPVQSLVAVTTHDLPTLAGFWQGSDLELRSELDLFPSEAQREEQLIRRAEDRARLLLALEHQALLPPQTSSNPVTVPEMTAELACAIHRYVARSPSQVMTVQMEDVFGQQQQVNLPGTDRQYPNWRHRLSVALEHWQDEPRLLRLTEAMRAERGSAARQPRSAIGASSIRESAEIPRATYRLQLNRDFTFTMAAELVPYLAELGISHCYTSPLLMARPGSTHGYDIVEHHRLNPELGSTEDFERFVGALREHGMGLIMDMVPNHMGVMGNDNPWWLDVLENGPAAGSARFFDIDWSPLKEALRGKVLLPVLGDHYGSVLEKGELVLAFDPEQGHFDIRYYEHRIPIDPGTYNTLLGHHLPQLDEQQPGVLEFASLNTAFGNLPPRTVGDEEKLAERTRDAGIHKQHLARLYRENANVARYIDEVVTAYNDIDDLAADATPLHRLLEQQPYRLAYWRVASDEINYRRFFDINELASLRMDDAQVFEATHALVFELIANGKVQGLRIDHPDGLYNPQHYFQRLQEYAAATRPATGNGGSDSPRQALYVVVEKILAAHERLPLDWPVHGTTGYDFSSLCNDLFVDPAAEKTLSRTYSVFSGKQVALEETRYQSKKLIMRVALASELNVLATQLSRIAEADTHTRDFTVYNLRSALAEVVACFPVYRTYVTDEGAADKDIDFVKWAAGLAKKRSLADDTSVFDFLLKVLLTTIKEGKSQAYRRQVLAFAMKFQQYSAPVMAKGMEDTAFYRYNRLVSLNEVGGEPDRFGLTPAVFHRANQFRQQNWPHAMLAGSTHDSKRSEDVRARINVLSELSDEWRTRLNRWGRINRNKKRSVDGQPFPSRNDEYLLYQTLIGTWPERVEEQGELDAYRERIEAYMNKALREAKQHTSWINPNADYEEAMQQFIGALLGRLDNNGFLADFIPFAQQCARFGFYNSLAQTQLRLTVPGVPDIYQGNELPTFNLVDPDNRRAVDFGRRGALLADLAAQSSEAGATGTWLAGLMENSDAERAKLYLIWKLLGLRRECPELFRDGDYQPLACEGEQADHLCAFARSGEGQQLISVTPRLNALLTGGAGAPLGDEVWGDTWIDTGIEAPDTAGDSDFLNLYSNERIRTVKRGGKYGFLVRELFNHFPVAVLISQ